MQQDVTPPAGSRIDVQSERGHRKIITIPHRQTSVFRYLVGAFLLVWLCGWLFGFLGAASRILDGEGGMFLMVWLALWTLGGLFAMFFAYRIFRPAPPERFVISGSSLDYDSGIAPFTLFHGFGMRGQIDFFRMLLAKRRRFEFGRNELSTLRLRETSDSNRLTIDLGAQRIDLATTASEIEREWLYNILQDTYA